MKLELPLRDRTQAGQLLAQELVQFTNEDVLVLALPRGGVPVAFEISQRLGAPLDVLLVRKLGAPGQRELAAGAIASGGVRVVNDEVVNAFRLTADDLDAIAEQELLELERRERTYRGDRAPPVITGRTIILVDDGVATGSTIRAAIAALRQLQAGRIVVAVPVGAAETIAQLRVEADEVICLATPAPFYAIGPWYRNFTQVDDDEVKRLLSAVEGS
jgi:putative phosphoribosyl transferase